METIGRFSHFALRAFWAALASLHRPRECCRQFYRIYVGALPLAGVTGLALGLVIWMHLHQVLLNLGTGYVDLLPRALGLAVTLEFAPIGAGLIVAGRSGASLGAELGSMKLSEQIDAIEVLGISPMKLLVGPRVLACILALPLLTVVITALAVAGSFLAEVLGGSMSWQGYQNELLRDLRLADVIPAILKTSVFGFLVGVTGCYFGVHADGGTEGVGRAATRGVVVSIFLVAVSNVFLVRIIQLIGA
ncbi:MAG: ABC transporter permease [Gemmatales bacterium]|nr:MAG: ABC transporter permease [Gemmatales bacterium]